MKRRDFLKVGVGTAITIPVVINEVTGKTVAEPVGYQDWSVKFHAVTASIATKSSTMTSNEAITPKIFLITCCPAPVCLTVKRWRA